MKSSRYSGFALGMDDAPEEENEGQDTSGHNVQKLEQEDNLSEKLEAGEKAADEPVLYPVQIASRSNTVGNGSLQGLKSAAGMADKPAQKVSLKEKLEVFFFVLCS